MAYRPRQARTQPRLSVPLNRGSRFARGLVAAYNFGGGGNIVRDLVGTNDLTSFNGDAAKASGIGGRGVEFDGAGDYVQAASSSSLLEGVAALSFLVVFRCDDYSSGGLWNAVGKRIAGGEGPFFFRGQGGQAGNSYLQFGVRNSSNSTVQAQTDGTPTAGKVIVAIGTYDGASLALYLDGVKQADNPSQTGVTDSGGDPIHFGRGRTGVGEWMDGAVYLCYLWDRALTAGEVLALSSNPYRLFGRSLYVPLGVDSGAQTLIPTGIAGAEAFGTAALTTGAVDISPTGVAGAEAFGSHLLGMDIAATGLAGSEAFGAHTLSPGAVNIAPTALAGAEAFGTAVLDAGQGLAATGIAGAEAFGTGSLTLHLTPTGIAGGEVFGTHTVSGGAITLSPTGIASTEAFGSALLTLYLTPTGVAGAEAFGTASVAQLIVPVGIAGAEAFGSHTVSPGAVSLSATGIAGAEAFGSHLITLDIAATGVAGAEAFGSHTVAVGSLNLAPTGIATAELFGTAVVSLANAQGVSPTGIASGETHGATTVSYTQALSPTGLAGAEAFGAGVVALTNTVAITFVTAHETSTTVTFTDTHGLIGTPTT